MFIFMKQRHHLFSCCCAWRKSLICALEIELNFIFFTRKTWAVFWVMWDRFCIRDRSSRRFLRNTRDTFKISGVRNSSWNSIRQDCPLHTSFRKLAGRGFRSMTCTFVYEEGPLRDVSDNNLGYSCAGIENEWDLVTKMWSQSWWRGQNVEKAVISGGARGTKLFTVYVFTEQHRISQRKSRVLDRQGHTAGGNGLYYYLQTKSYWRKGAKCVEIVRILTGPRWEHGVVYLIQASQKCHVIVVVAIEK